MRNRFFSLLVWRWRPPPGTETASTGGFGGGRGLPRIVKIKTRRLLRSLRRVRETVVGRQS